MHVSEQSSGNVRYPSLSEDVLIAFPSQMCRATEDSSQLAHVQNTKLTQASGGESSSCEAIEKSSRHRRVPDANPVPQEEAMLGTYHLPEAGPFQLRKMHPIPHGLGSGIMVTDFCAKICVYQDNREFKQAALGSAKPKEAALLGFPETLLQPP